MIELIAVTQVIEDGEKEKLINPLRVILVTPSKNGSWIDIDDGHGTYPLKVKEAATEISKRWAKAMRCFTVVTPSQPEAQPR